MWGKIIMYHVSTMSLQQAKEISKWEYPFPYDVYNLPTWNIMEENGWGITLPERREKEFRVITQAGKIVAFFRLSENLSDGNYHLGLGLMPKFCGAGKGAAIMELILAYARELGVQKLYLEVRDFNKRAIRCYQKAGFVEVTRYEKSILDNPCMMIQMLYSF